MPPLTQLTAVTGQPSPVSQSDLNRARLPSLYGAREQALRERQFGLAERGLNLQAAQADLAASQANKGLLIQGGQTLVSGAGLAETAFPGSISGLFSGGGAGAATAGTSTLPLAGAAGAGLASGAAGAGAAGAAGAAAFPGTAGLLSPAGLPLAASVAGPAAGAGAAGAASGAATASGLAGAAGSGGTATAAGTGLATVAPFAAPVAAGFVGGKLGAEIGEAILPFGGKTGQKIERGLGGAAGGALAGAAVGSIIPGVGTAIGAIFGAVVGGITGSVSIIATVCYGPMSQETQMAQRFRKRFVGQITYQGYLAWGTPIARLVQRHPWLRPLVKAVLVDPCLVAMQADLHGCPPSHAYWPRKYLKLFLWFSHRVGKRQRRVSASGHGRKRTRTAKEWSAPCAPRPVTSVGR